MLGIYIHIPFCKYKCNYCDFLSCVPSVGENIDRYTNSLIKELDMYGKLAGDRVVDTIYFGGGTPSLLSSEAVDRILNLIANSFNVTSECEITMEMNPDSVTGEWISSIVKSGVNRASVGLQTSDNTTLKLLNRITTVEQFYNTVNYLHRYNLSNFSADLMLGLPSQTIELAAHDAKMLVDVGAKHISAYSLILHEETKIFKAVKEGRLTLPSEEYEREMYHELTFFLRGKGFKRYEVSNFAPTGFESRHNLKYWDLSEYIGTGLGASGYIDDMRVKNPSDFKTYYSRINDECRLPFDIEYRLELKDKLSEYSFLSIRTEKGIDVKEFNKRFNKNFFDVFDLSEHFKNDLIVYEDNHIKLTDKGFDLSNLVECDLILE